MPVPSHVVPQVRDLGQMLNSESGGTKEGEDLCPGNDVGARVGPDYAIVYKDTAGGTGGRRAESIIRWNVAGAFLSPNGVTAHL